MTGGGGGGVTSLLRPLHKSNRKQETGLGTEIRVRFANCCCVAQISLVWFNGLV